MNKDEATKQWIAEYRTRMTRAMSDEEMAREMYEAGQRAERVRIVFELDELLGDVGDGKLARFMDELRDDPAESGE